MCVTINTNNEGNIVMRKLYFTAAAATALFTATGAGADSFQHTVSLSATAPHVCSFAGAVLTNTQSFINVGAASSSLSVDVGAENIAEQTASLTFANVFCNGNNTTVQLKRDGLMVDAPEQTAPGFKQEIEYDVAVTWGGVDIVALDSSNDETARIGAMRGDFVINIHVPARPGPFVADTYTDMLVLTVQPTT
jgi:hypothetical protein